METLPMGIFETIFINNIGKPLNVDFGSKVKVTECSQDPMLYEIPTLNRIKLFARDNHHNVNVLYIHTKGVSFDDNYQEENDWIDMMLHFLCDKICPDLLDENVVLGCNYTTTGKDYHPDGTTTTAPPHFSGNFWWAQTEYLKNLNELPLKNINKNDAEYWLMKNSPKFLELHNSGVDHYKTRYPPERYR
jgi:hypothetical protein